MKRYSKRDLFTLVSVLLVLVLLFVVPSVCVNLSYANPPIPQIKYGEFPFRLEYEINGRGVVVEDTLIIKYDGIKTSVSTGKSIKWKAYLASNKKESNILLLKIDEKTGVYYCVGDPKFYMGDGGIAHFPVYIQYKSGNHVSIGGPPDDELLERYGIKIISWEFSDPIVNTFK